MIFILILSIRSNGDQMNALLLILHLIPISTPPTIDRNSALMAEYHTLRAGYHTLMAEYRKLIAEYHTLMAEYHTRMA